MKKTLVISAVCFPPVVVGPAVLLRNLFSHFSADSYCVMTGRLDHNWRYIDPDSILPCRYYYTRFPQVEGKSWRYFLSIIRELVLVPINVWKGIRIVKHESIELIFAVADCHMEVVALLIHWLTKIPLILYFPDLYYAPGRDVSGWNKSVQKRFEPILIKAAETVLVCSPPTQEYYYKKYGCNTKLLPHTTNIKQYKGVNSAYLINNGKLNIVFTGEISEAQLDSILNLVQVVNDYPELNAIFLVVSNVRLSSMKPLGIHGPNIVCRQANRDEIPALQQSSDVLFLPLSFTWKSPEIIRTASPSKMPEYLAAGRPILVHAPSYSYVANYARKEGFGLVVDRLDSGLLRRAILDLKHDAKLCHRLVINAKKVAKKHDAAILSQKLHNILQ